MKHTNKRGFTIVELVIVIAVIAILAAVLIPTFSSIVRKAQVSNDNQLVRNANLALKAQTSKANNMTEALQYAKDFGYDLEKIAQTKASDTTVLWDSENNLFCYLDGEIKYNGSEEPASRPADVAYWVISTDAKVNAPYSTYYAGNDNSATTINKAVGFDVGNSGITSVTYDTTDSAAKIIVRTASGNLSVKAPNIDKIEHYGAAENLNVIEVKDASYHEFGTIAKVLMQKGHFVAEATSNIVALVATQAGNPKIDMKLGAKIATAFADLGSYVNSGNVVFPAANAIGLAVNTALADLGAGYADAFDAFFGDATTGTIAEKVQVLGYGDLIEGVINAITNNDTPTNPDPVIDDKPAEHVHTYGAVLTKYQDDDSTKGGYTYHVCSGCGNQEILSIIPAATQEFVPYNPPTPTPAGPVGTAIANYEQLVAAFENGGEYYLSADVTITAGIKTATDSVTLDFNGHNITVANGAQSNSDDCMLSVEGSGKELVFNGTGSLVYANPGGHTEAVLGGFGGASIVINGGTFLSATDYLLGGVGNHLVINGGSIVGSLGTFADSTITVNLPCVLRVTNDMLPFTFLGNTVTCPDNLQYAITGTGFSDPEATITVTAK